LGFIRKKLVTTARLSTPDNKADPMSTTSLFDVFATMKIMADANQTANPQAIAEHPNWKDPTITDAL